MSAEEARSGDMFGEGIFQRDALSVGESGTIAIGSG